VKARRRWCAAESRERYAISQLERLFICCDVHTPRRVRDNREAVSRLVAEDNQCFLCSPLTAAMRTSSMSDGTWSRHPDQWDPCRNVQYPQRSRHRFVMGENTSGNSDVRRPLNWSRSAEAASSRESSSASGNRIRL
jgi:hypothetical protein